MAKDNTQNLKEAAVRFLELVVAGRIDDAYRDYVDMGGKHHNVYFEAGFPALKKAMIEDHAANPGKRLMVRNVVGDGDLVAVHSHLTRRPGDSGFAVMHLFRFFAGRVVEMWDFAVGIPPDSPNADGAF
jgi:predicted SnoaL-like aldol condensation-catalyzing enzyme